MTFKKNTSCSDEIKLNEDAVDSYPQFNFILNVNLVIVFAACLQTISLLGPMFGFLLGSYCARLYVDIGYVDMGKLLI